MSQIPKAFVRIKTTLALEPSEKQLLEFYKDYGYSSIKDILEGHGGGDWGEVIREWFVNTYYNQEYKKLNENKNILQFDDYLQEDIIEIINNKDWENYRNEGLIF